jgi:hypothetical protein
MPKKPLRAFDGSSLVAVIGDEVPPFRSDFGSLSLRSMLLGLLGFRTPSLGFCSQVSESEMSKEKPTF